MSSEAFLPRLALVVAVALGPSCAARDTVLHPTFADGGLLAQASAVPEGALVALDGMYRVSAGGVFGPELVAVRATRDTVSIFAASNDAYAVMHAGCLEGGTRLILEGVWRYPAATNTGLVRFSLGPSALAAAVCAGNVASLPVPPPSPTLEGTTGAGSGAPTAAAGFAFDHALKPTEGRFVVIAHHGACTTADDCGASENSLASVRMAQSFGADVVELDVQLTADGVPILYHDDHFTGRLATGPLCHGPVADFTLADVRANCILKFGESVPTLEEALATVIDDTTLRGFWLDVKHADAIASAVSLTEKYAAIAAQKKRRVHFAVGLVDEDSVAAYTGIVPAPKQTSCLAELTPADVRSANCAIWGPDWTLGPSASDVAALQAEGRAVVFWTMDEQAFIDAYLTATTPNGIVTDRPGLVLHRFQMLGTLPPVRAQL